MSFKPDDISQIRKYLNGELDARAMHRLEKRAQDDPFLMDALEGYTNRKDQQANIEEMQQKLQRRVRKGMKKPVALWPLISVAASVLVFITLGAWWVLFNEPSAKKRAVKQAEKTAVVFKSDTKVQKPVPPMPQPSSNAALSATGPVTAKSNRSVLTASISHNTKLSATPANSTAQNSPKAVVNKSNRLATISPLRLKTQPSHSDTSSHMLAEVAMTGYATQRKTDVTASVAAIDKSLSYTAVSGKTDENKRFVTGQLIDAKDHQPLQGAWAQIQGTKTGTTTDANGRFKIEAAKDDVLSLGYIGYESRQIQAKDINQPVALEPSNRSLSEVRVTDSKTGQPAVSQPLAPKSSTVKKAAADSNVVPNSDVPITTVNGFRRITGRVTTVIGNIPVPQAIIWNKGTDRQYATDSKGYFSLDARKGDELYVGYDGFKNEKVVVGKKDKINIEIERKGASMYDAFVKTENFNPYDDLAHPVIGWDKFRSLQNKVKSPDGKTGSVKLKFTVKVDNTVTDFVILESLSAAADAAAIRFVNEDNKWLHNTNNKPQEITLKIKFKK